MQRIMYCLALLLTIFSCSSDDDNFNNRGTFQLSAIYSDPGDGSGGFQNVDSRRTITFLTDSTFVINANICDYGTETAALDTISFDPTDNTINDSCNNGTPWPIHFSITPEVLILNLPCIEACQHEYTVIW